MSHRTYIDSQPEGDYVSEYGNGWQRAYCIPKEKLNYWREQATKKYMGGIALKFFGVDAR